MKFMLTYAFTTDNWVAGLKRFTSGDPAEEFPEGVTMIGRWHNGASRSGIAIIESASAEALMNFAVKWNDILDLTITPVVEDAEAGQVAVELIAERGW